MSFINAATGRNFTKATIGNPYNIRALKKAQKKGKLQETEVDVFARLDDGILATIEMQVIKENFFTERAVFYAFEKYISNFAVKELARVKEGGHEVKYSSLRPIYSINILYYNLYNDSDAVHRCTIYDNVHNTHLSGVDDHPIFNMIFLEIKKMTDGELGQWLRFLFTGIAPTGSPKAIEAASSIVEYTNLTKEEQEMLDAKERAKADLEDQLYYQWKEGEKRGKKRGITIGEHRNAVETAKKMIDEGFKPETINRLTGLSFEEIEKLR